MAPTLEPLFRTLSDDIAAGEYKKALDACNRILTEAPEDEDALKCKTLCFIHLNQFSEALSFLDKHSTLADQMVLEKAYCLYKVREHEKALHLIDQIDNPSEVAIHLKSQTYFRLEDYDKALAEYKNLPNEKETTKEVLVNVIAVNTARQSFDESVISLFKDEALQNSSYETCFNLACISIRRGDLKTAENLLLKAEQVCKDTLPSQGYSETEILDELAGIKVQLGYIYQVTDRADSAAELYEDVLKHKPSDAGVAAIAYNNIASASKGQKAEKSLFHAQQVDKYKLTNEQRKMIIFNRVVVYLKLGKPQKCKEIIEEFRKEFPQSSLPLLLESALLFKEKQKDEVFRLLGNQIQARADANDSSPSSESDLQTSLCLAHLLLKDGKSQEALRVFEKLGPDSHRAGIVATRVKLHLQLSEPEQATLVLDQAVSFWKEKDPHYSAKILHSAAELKMQQSRFQEASEYYRDLIRLEPEKKHEVFPLLVIALSHFDPAAALKEAQTFQIPSVAYNLENINVEELENRGSFRSHKPNPHQLATSGSGDQVVDRKKKSKKKKKKRLPKKYDPNVEPDPDRWLPRRDRASTKKRRTNKLRRGHQGAASAPEPAKPATPVAAAAKPAAPAAKPAAKPARGKKKGKR